MAKILVVDDDRIVRLLLQEMISREGHTVSAFENAQDALASVSKAPPELVITDIFMPEKSGLEMIVELRRVAPEIPIIAISGDSASREGGHVECLEVAKCLGSSRILEKPFTKQQVLDAVRKALAEASPES